MRIIDYFDNGAKYYPTQTAFVDLDQGNAETSYAEAHAATHRIAAAIRGKGYAKGAHIGILAPNSTIAFLALLGLFRAEGVWLPINPRNPVPVNADLLSRYASPGSQLFLVNKRTPQPDLVRDQGLEFAGAPSSRGGALQCKLCRHVRLP